MFVYDAVNDDSENRNKMHNDVFPKTYLVVFSHTQSRYQCKTTAEEEIFGDEKLNPF